MKTSASTSALKSPIGRRDNIGQIPTCQVIAQSHLCLAAEHALASAMQRARALREDIEAEEQKLSGVCGSEAKIITELEASAAQQAAHQQCGHPIADASLTGDAAAAADPDQSLAGVIEALESQLLEFRHYKQSITAHLQDFRAMHTKACRDALTARSQLSDGALIVAKQQLAIAMAEDAAVLRVAGDPDRYRDVVVPLDWDAFDTALLRLHTELADVLGAMQ